MRDPLNYKTTNEKHAFIDQYSEKLRFENLGKLVNNYLKTHTQAKPRPISAHTIFQNADLDETHESFVNMYSTQKTLVTLYRDFFTDKKSDEQGPYRRFKRGILSVQIDSDDLNEINTIRTDLDEIVRAFRTSNNNF